MTQLMKVNVIQMLRWRHNSLLLYSNQMPKPLIQKISTAHIIFMTLCP